MQIVAFWHGGCCVFLPVDSGKHVRSVCLTFYPVVLATVDDSCLHHQLLFMAWNDLHSTFTTGHPSVKKKKIAQLSPPPHPSFLLTLFYHQDGLLNPFFFLPCVLVHSCHYSFWCLNCPRFGQREPIQTGSLSLFSYFPYFLEQEDVLVISPRSPNLF